ncbi:unnamed protein product [Caenorhabditis auriculariae]|uniref:G-protein coupled receptors family 1 profile domain-containing protein n=1 Tax=Caenorhabditis auriculariae TaxID=2777116 RepID=A0A8S1H840_9PELO|nr:unnamed protein product [Caenorhabditis auriculariae]
MATVGIVEVLSTTPIYVETTTPFVATEDPFPFFAIVYHLTVANAIHMLILVSTVLPIMLIEASEDTPQRTWYQWGSRILMVTEYGSLYFTLLMTINRFAVFVWPSLLLIFSKKGIHLMAAFVWAYVIFIVYWNVNWGTVKSFSKKKIAVNEVLLGTNELTSFFTVCSTVLPLVMLVMYGIIFVFIIKKRMIVSSDKKTERDKSLLWQALIVTLSLELMNITDMVTPFLKFGTTWVQWTWTIVIYSISILNQLVNPVMFLLTNKMVRGILWHMFDKNFSKFLSESSEGRTRRGAGPAAVRRHRPILGSFFRGIQRQYFGRLLGTAPNTLNPNARDTIVTF